MFRSLPMRRVTLLFLASEAQDAALLLARHGVFAPAPATSDLLPEVAGTDYREVFLEAEARLAKIMEMCGEIPLLPIPPDAIAPNLRELEGINGRLREIWQACSSCYETERRLEEASLRLTKLGETFQRLQSLDVDLDRLLKPDSLLDARIGQLPLANVRRLGEALGLAHYLLTVFDKSGDQAYAVVAGPRGESGLGGLLTQAGWRELPVPPELQTHLDAARRYLEQARQEQEADTARHCELRLGHLAHYKDWLSQARLLLILARPLAESSLAGHRGRGQLAGFTGWVPKQSLEALRAALESRFQGRYLMQASLPQADETDKVPSLLTYPGWLKPFVPLVRSYGVPRYGEFDPALLFAITYLLLLGAMFGDVGHGAVILSLSLFLGGRLAWLRWVGMLAGASSILFGLLYGSVFGFEDWLHPLWQSPMHDPGHMLALAVASGIAFIAVTLVINIYNRLAAGRIEKALLDGGGLAGLVFFLSMGGGLYKLFTGGTFGGLQGLLAVAGIAAIAFHSWRETQGDLGERLLVCLIEALETGISLFANTLSFLRVAAFSLNHVALALAVFTLANGLDALGYGLTLVLGNGVIIVLEGGIVAIQALRLMYYEGFSRFFSGDGVEFVPLRLEMPGFTGAYRQ
jgi:V/A-type H+-transporting ATPase subunit I